MPKRNKDAFLMSETQTRKFKMWLFMNGLTIRKFAVNCGVSAQYIDAILNRKVYVSPKVIETFCKGGYTIKQEIGGK
jgi:transcriptional regulator with XRE-family HTH domain